MLLLFLGRSTKLISPARNLLMEDILMEDLASDLNAGPQPQTGLRSVMRKNILV